MASKKWDEDPARQCKNLSTFSPHPQYCDFVDDLQDARRDGGNLLTRAWTVGIFILEPTTM